MLRFPPFCEKKEREREKRSKERVIERERKRERPRQRDKRERGVRQSLFEIFIQSGKAAAFKKCLPDA
jgi:hypothetical protein